MAGGRDRAALPTGTVTLVLGDVEGSTRLWEEQPDEVAAATAALDATISRLVARHGGARPVEQGEGDSFVAAFAGTAEAVGFALELQGSLEGGLLRLRLGINTGDVRLRDEGNYAGPTVNRAARVRDAGHGGQVLLSNTIAELVRDGLPEGASLLDLGTHRLRDLERPEHVWQLQHPDLRADFPPLRVPDLVRSNLSHALTSFVGRVEELERVGQLLEDDRCVTITGAGGCGKTRLASEVAGARLAEHPAGIWFVDLAATDRAEAVNDAVADTMQLAGSTVPAHRRIMAAVGEQPVLLVLDNCEHVIDACTRLIETVLRHCPRLRVLATSREPLGVAGEVTYRLPSLPPGDAAALFVERARRAAPAADLEREGGEVISEICAQLDGMPLAIELAAARLRVFTPEQVLAGLQDRFRLLTGGSRTAMPRQQTLQASVDWSHSLLLDVEQALLRRLAVFADGFTVEAATDVAGFEPLQPHHVFELLAQLVDKSLVVADDERVGRFRVLETVRQYAMERLVAAGEAAELRQRHFGHFAAIARRVPGEPTDAHRRRVAVDEANVRRALDWAAAQDDHSPLADVCYQLFPYWTSGRRAAEGAAWHARVRTHELDLARQAKVVGRRGYLVGMTGDWSAALPDCEEALRLARECGDPSVLVWALLEVCSVRANVGIVSLPDLEEALALAEAIDDRQAVAMGCWHLGVVHARNLGDVATGRPLLQRSLALCDAHGYGHIGRLARAWLALTDLIDGRGIASLPAMTAAADDMLDAGEHFLLLNLWAIEAGLRAGAGDDDLADRVLGRLEAVATEVEEMHGAAMVGLGRALVGFARADWEGMLTGLVFLDLMPEGTAGIGLVYGIRAIAHAMAGGQQAALEDADHALRVGGDDGSGALGWVARSIVADALGRPDEAWALALDGASLNDHTSAMGHFGLVLPHVAHLAAAAGRFDEAARTLGASTALLEAGGASTSTGVVTALAADAPAATRVALGDERYDELFAEGAALDWDGIVAYLRRGRGSRQRPAMGWGSLTRTEEQVVALVVEGLANKEVAARLFMSVATVKTHLTHAYAKLGVASRTQLVAAARDRRVE